MPVQSCVQGSEQIDVGRPPGDAQADSACGAIVASDSACTVGIIGSGEIPYVHRVWTAPVVTVRTVSGAVSSSQMGAVVTVDAEGNEREFQEYLVPECPYCYSLWPLANQIGADSVCTQTAHSAQIQYPDGRVSSLRREGGLWVVDVVESDEGGAVACAVEVIS